MDKKKRSEKEKLINAILGHNNVNEEKMELSQGAKNEDQQKPPKNVKEKKWKSIDFWGAIGSIIGALIALYLILPSNQKDEENYDYLNPGIKKKENADIDDPSKRQEYEKKFEEGKKELEELLKNEEKKVRQKALAYYKRGDFSPLRKLVLEIKQKESARSKHWVGETYFLEFKYKEALESYLEADRLDPDNWKYKNAIGSGYLWLGDYESARYYFLISKDLVFKTYGENDRHLAPILNNLGEVSRELGQYKKAIDYHEQALNLIFKNYDESHPDVADSWNNIGCSYFR